MTMRRLTSSILTTAAVLATSGIMASPASASLVYDSSLSTSAQGFGAAPRALVIQATGQDTRESSCVGVSSSGGITIGSSSCMTAATTPAVHDSNGVPNLGGQETPPLTDNQKFGIPTIGSLGITTATQIGILFNATEPGGDGITLTDLTLKFYTSAGVLLGAIDGQQAFPQTEVGNGSAGVIFRVSSDEQAFVNSLLANGATTTLALEATATGYDGGEESFRIVNLGRAPVPEPATWAMMLVGFGAAGYSLRRRRRVRALQAA